jgi:putative ABC transport system ATP-binding protein
MGDIIARAENVAKRYRHGSVEVAALRGVSLEIAPGEFLAVMGPSGSGKSTLLHLLGGLDAPDAGRVVVAGRALGTMSDDEMTMFRRRHIGIVFQFFNLLPALTAEENVALPLMLDGTPRRAAHARAADALAQVGLRQRRCHTPDELSGGELQRVAIARALVTEPLLILADEPTGNLDSRAGGEVLRALRCAADTLRRAVVLVTHDPGAGNYTDRVVKLLDGAIEDDRARMLRSAHPAS